MFQAGATGYGTCASRGGPTWEACSGRTRSDLDLTFRDVARLPVGLGAEWSSTGSASTSTCRSRAAPRAPRNGPKLAALAAAGTTRPSRPGEPIRTEDPGGGGPGALRLQQALSGVDHRGLSNDDCGQRTPRTPPSCSGDFSCSRIAQAPEAAADDGAGDDEESFIDDEWLDSPGGNVERTPGLGRDPGARPFSGLESPGGDDDTRSPRPMPCLGALGHLTHGLDSDTLILPNNLDPDDETLAWITETGPGGKIGAVGGCCAQCGIRLSFWPMPLTGAL